MQSRCDLMTRDTVEALRRAGCAEVWMGAESGSQRILDAMDKGSRVRDIYRARENLRRHGIRACFFLQFGYPGETWNEIEETIRMVRETRPDDIGVSVSYPLPGTRFYQLVGAQLGQKSNWSDSADLAMMFRGEYSSEFYRALADALHAEVRGGFHCESSGWERVRELAAGVRVMRLLLTHAYFLSEDPKERQIMKPYAPLGILYLSSYLRGQGFDVDIYDSTFGSREELFAILDAGPPAAIGIYGNLMTRRNVLDIAARARAAGWKVILGGPEPANYADEYLGAGADLIVDGRGRIRHRTPVGREPESGRMAIHSWNHFSRARWLRVPHRSRAAHSQSGCPAVARSRTRRHSALPQGMAGASRHRLRIGDHRARLPLPLQLVQPLRLWQDAPPPLAEIGCR